jgi:hypothetical protein
MVKEEAVVLLVGLCAIAYSLNRGAAALGRLADLAAGNATVVG